jgi:hypothetical protein
VALVADNVLSEPVVLEAEASKYSFKSPWHLSTVGKKVSRQSDEYSADANKDQGQGTRSEGDLMPSVQEGHKQHNTANVPRRVQPSSLPVQSLHIRIMRMSSCP